MQLTAKRLYVTAKTIDNFEKINDLQNLQLM